MPPLQTLEVAESARNQCWHLVATFTLQYAAASIVMNDVPLSKMAVSQPVPVSLPHLAVPQFSSTLGH